MPRKVKRKVAKKKKPKQAGGSRRMLKGDGFFGDIGNWFKKTGNTIYDKAIRPTYDKVIRPAYDKGLKPAWNYTKDNKLISKGLGIAGSFIPGPAGGVVKAGALGAALGGYGKKRMRGAGNERMFGCAISN